MDSASVVIIGGGIVGSALAYFLAESASGKVIVIERSMHEHVGSTALAPGLVGTLNESRILTQLASKTVEDYKCIPGGFDAIGNLEVYEVTNHAAVEQRAELAHAYGIRATLLNGEEAAYLVPDFLSASDVNEALFFPDDGTADPSKITDFYRGEAEARGAKFEEEQCLGLEYKDGSTCIVRTATRDWETSTIIMATGIWTPQMVRKVTTSPLPVFPVTHPYLYSERRERLRERCPFVRWPDSHVYARFHNDKLGFGTYDHVPTIQEPELGAKGRWLSELFDKPVDRTKSNMNISDSDVQRKVNGIFAITPDNLPLAGKLAGPSNVYLCSAVWITHAAATARFLVSLIQGGKVDDEVVQALSPNRFDGRSLDELRREALGRYNDIYNSQPLEQENTV